MEQEGDSGERHPEIRDQGVAQDHSQRENQQQVEDDAQGPIAGDAPAAVWFGLDGQAQGGRLDRVSRLELEQAGTDADAGQEGAD